jgi:hypothetical protein
MIAVLEELTDEHTFIFFCPPHLEKIIKRVFPDSLFIPIPYLRLVYEDFRVDYVRTTFENIKKILVSGFIIKELSDELSSLRVDAVLSDFEPFLPEAASRLGLPILQLNHPGVVTRVPAYVPEAIISRIVAARMMSKFDKELICSFYAGDVGPILRREIRSLRPLRGEDYLVYIKPEFKERLLGALAGMDCSFRVFPNPDDEFLSALASCKGIIGPSGIRSPLRHSSSESDLRHPGEKPVRAKAQRRDAETLGTGGNFGEPDSFEPELKNFVENIDSYPRPCSDPNIAFRFGDETAKAASLIEEFFRSRMRGESRGRRYFKISWFYRKAV